MSILVPFMPSRWPSMRRWHAHSSVTIRMRLHEHSVETQHRSNRKALYETYTPCILPEIQLPCRSQCSCICKGSDRYGRDPPPDALDVARGDRRTSTE